MATPKQLILPFFFLLSLSSIALSEGEDCVYTIYIRTGTIIKGGTNSVISLKLYDAKGEYVEIENLEAWGGLMGEGHDYYERGNLDIFAGRGRCLASPVCAMNLTSDGTGPQHGWYCNYVEVTMTGIHTPCSQQMFAVEQWLAFDTLPFDLTAIRNYCSAELRTNQQLSQEVPSRSST
ncbi:hypothetical protein Gohar_018320 [Gossypium harknessii]|uniref:PLAT domain-containing protein n=1 Tax=Gossypium harknessii TaxID=34285 RepID=A0A7J9G8S6_9ROSI|nr:hypothetical protein [Gossypium harknessii]